MSLLGTSEFMMFKIENLIGIKTSVARNGNVPEIVYGTPDIRGSQNSCLPPFLFRSETQGNDT